MKRIGTALDNACQTFLRRTSMNRLALRCLLVLGLATAASAAADTAVVPTEFATIQEAVDAVQGTPSPLVRIDSDATFTEMVAVTQSVTIEAGAGFTPTLQGTTSGGCVFLGGCAVLFNPTGTQTTNFVLSGLRFLPATGAVSSHRIIQMYNESSAISFLTGEILEFEDPAGSGATVLSSRVGPPNTGENRISLRESSATVGGSAGFTARAFVIEDEGRLELEDVTLVMRDAPALGFLARGTQGDGVTFILRDSLFDIAVPGGGFSSEVGFLASFVTATIERNRFLLRGAAAPSATGGIEMATADGTNPETQSLVLDANEFVGLGGNTTRALVIAPQPGDSAAIIATNNVVRSMSSGFVAAPQSSAGSQTGGIVAMTLVNNTVHASADSAVVLERQPFTIIDAGIYNNLFTGSGGFGIEVEPGGGTLSPAIGHNGYFANALGDLDAPLADPDGVFADPRYLSSEDLRLRIGSPMLNAGDNSAPNITALDAAQQPRIQDGTVDIGAYEGAVQLSVIEVPTLRTPLLVLLAGLLAALAVWRLASFPPASAR
jgi:hypothetical protein